MKKAPQIVLFAVLAITVWLAPSGAIPAETTKIDKQIGGLTLKEAVDYAVVHNPSILKAQSEIAASHGDVIKARSHFLPKLEANGGVEQSIHQDIVTVKAGTFGNPTDIPFPLTSKTIPYASLKLEQLIYDFGLSTNKYREATLGEQISSQIKDLTSQDIALRVVNAYLDVLLARKKIELAKSTLDAYESHYQTAEKLYQAGSIPKSDLLAANFTRSRAALDLDGARNDVHIAELNFEKVVGLKPGELDRRIIAFHKPAYTLEDKVGYAKEHRLELAVNDGLQKIAQAQKSQATSSYLPKFLVKGEVTYRDDSYLAHKDQVRVLAGMQWSLFDGLAAYGARKRAEASKDASGYSRESLLDQIEVEVTRAHLDLEQAVRAIDVAKKNMEDATENLRIVKERYAAGDAPATDVLDGIRGWSSASYNHVEAIYTLNLNIARLKRATGENITGEL